MSDTIVRICGAIITLVFLWTIASVFQCLQGSTETQEFDYAVFKYIDHYIILNDI